MTRRIKANVVPTETVATKELKEVMINDYGMVTSVATVDRLSFSEEQANNLTGLLKEKTFGSDTADVVRMILKNIRVGTIAKFAIETKELMYLTIAVLANAKENIYEFFDASEKTAEEIADRATSEHVMLRY